MELRYITVPSEADITNRSSTEESTPLLSLKSQRSTDPLPLTQLKPHLMFSVCVLEAHPCNIDYQRWDSSIAFNARWLKLLSCLSLQAQQREQESCLCWTAVLLPACSLALVSGPVISVSGLSRQPTKAPTSQRRAHPGRDRCQQLPPSVPPPPPPFTSPPPHTHICRGRCLLQQSLIFEAEQLGKKGHLCHPFTVAISQETAAPSAVWERSCQIRSIHQRRLSRSESITDWGWVLTDWHTDWQLYCVLWGTRIKGSYEEAFQTQTALGRARKELLVSLYALLFLCVESRSFSWQHDFLLIVQKQLWRSLTSFGFKASGIAFRILCNCTTV